LKSGKYFGGRPLASDANPDTNHGIEKAQKWLMPSVLGTDDRDDHDDNGGNRGCENVFTTPRHYHHQRAHGDENWDANR
jgi:hypothetical protein